VQDLLDGGHQLGGDGAPVRRRGRPVPGAGAQDRGSGQHQGTCGCGGTCHPDSAANPALIFSASAAAEHPEHAVLQLRGATDQCPQVPGAVPQAQGAEDADEQTRTWTTPRLWLWFGASP